MDSVLDFVSVRILIVSGSMRKVDVNNVRLIILLTIKADVKLILVIVRMLIMLGSVFRVFLGMFCKVGFATDYQPIAIDTLSLQVSVNNVFPTSHFKESNVNVWEIIS